MTEPQPKPKLAAIWVWVTDRFLHGRSWWITDDLRRWVRCFRPSLTKRGDDITGGAMSAKGYAELRKRLRKRSATLSIGVFGGWLMMGLAGVRVIESAVAISRTGFGAVTLVEVVITICIGAAGFVTVRGLGNNPDDIARELKSMGRCGTCAFDLSGHVSDDAGVTMCPECRSAWAIASGGSSA